MPLQHIGRCCKGEFCKLAEGCRDLSGGIGAGWVLSAGTHSCQMAGEVLLLWGFSTERQEGAAATSVQLLCTGEAPLVVLPKPAGPGMNSGHLKAARSSVCHSQPGALWDPPAYCQNAGNTSTAGQEGRVQHPAEGG